MIQNWPLLLPRRTSGETLSGINARSPYERPSTSKIMRRYISILSSVKLKLFIRLDLHSNLNILGDRQKPNVQRELVQVSRTTAWVPDGRVMRTEAWRLRMYRYAIPRLGKKGMTLALTLNRDPLNQYQPSGWALFWRTAAFTMLRLLAFDRNLFLIDVRLLFLFLKHLDYIFF